MTREEFDKRIEDTKRWRNGALMALDISNEYIASLEATIEAQGIIIKDMAQPKTCELDCVYLDNEYGCQCPFPCKRSEDDDIKDYYEPKAQP